MAPLSLQDELFFARIKSDSSRLLCDNPDIPVDESNLVLKAVSLFENRVGRKISYEIDLIKRIPHGAGLGGGSSDAATTLIALNELEEENLPTEELLAMAGKLGADVSYFIQDSICRCTGIGEKIEKLAGLRDFKANVLLLKPSFGVSTPEAYKRWGKASKLQGISYEPQYYNGVEFINDLEQPVFEKYIFLAELKQWLLGRYEVKIAMMSGSGSTIFAIIPKESDARKIVSEVKKNFDPTIWTWYGTCNGK